MYYLCNKVIRCKVGAELVCGPLASERNAHKVRPYIVSLLCSVFFVLCSCSTARQPVVVRERHDSIRIEYRHYVDTVLQYRYVRQRGDTVFQTDTIIKIRIRERSDTVRLHDSVPYPVEVVREVPRPRTAYDRFCSCFFWIVCLSLIGTIVLRILK